MAGTAGSGGRLGGKAGARPALERRGGARGSDRRGWQRQTGEAGRGGREGREPPGGVSAEGPQHAPLPETSLPEHPLLPGIPGVSARSLWAS